MSLLPAGPAVLMVTGMLVFGYGVRVDDTRLRLAGIVLLGLAFTIRMATRLVQRRQRVDDDAQAG